MAGRGRRRRNVPNVSQRVVGSTPSLRPNSLPSQYNFTPAVQVPPTQSPQVPPAVLPEEVENNPQPQATPQQEAPTSPIVQDSPAHSQAHPHTTSSQGNNFQDDIPHELSELQADSLWALNALLSVPGRENWTTVLSPLPMEDTTWFTRDKGNALVRKITKVWTNKFDAPFYSFTLVPVDRRERYFLEFAKTHHWDPLIPGTVQYYFEDICQRRMKDMEELLGRAVSHGEVSIKTHTRPDGMYVDQKAEKIATTYQQNVELRLSELEADASPVSDGESRPRELTTEDYTTIFLQSTEMDSRGNPYGIGSLKETLGKRKRYGQSSSSSSSFLDLQEQLKEAQRKIEEQAAYNERRDSEDAARKAEQTRAAAEQKDKLKHLSLLEKYLRQTDPHFLDFMATHSAPQDTTNPLSPLPQNDP
ncbi:unnamed protein product [Arabidopsis arenosa]|uniref:Uncharacterized protein n=1 Tax=Arabidopsis arenosa TaxID=38785 RepID=A0A8S2A265_ARAAE|nr:unnamed protein product [Arabidopsis arenosa]